ncbi:MAG: outer membrane protein assembly factor BamC [Gammaproteobacteria bacterium]|nr:outer membrane protein assembly factor BamC [Gammaproteobacteria bacterium]
MHRSVLIISMLVSGCGWLSDDKGIFVNSTDDYLDARENPDLIIPEDLDRSRVQDPFPIPEVSKQLNAVYYSDRAPSPDTIYASDNRDEVRIQSLASRRWLAIPESPSTVWPKVKQFLAENGVTVVNEVSAFGRLDTQWMTLDDETYKDVVRLVIRDARTELNLTTGRDRIRVRVEQGLRERTSEIHIRHENDSVATPAPEDVVDLIPLESDIATAEYEMLKELGAYIAAKVSEQTASMLADNIPKVVKSILERNDQGEPILRLRLDYERAWATLGNALDNAGVEVLDSDRATGVLTVRISQDVFTGDDPGFLGRLWPFGEDDEQLLQINITPDELDSFIVSVRTSESEAVDRELSQQVLVLIREYAS